MVREIEKIRIDVDAPQTRRVRTLRGNLYPVGRALVTPHGSGAVEDFGAGETATWQFWHAEAHYILAGAADVKYSLPPWFDEAKTMRVEAGDFYIIPPGADMTWTVTSAGPLRKLCVILPNERLYQEVRPLQIERLTPGGGSRG
jgi:mannose-6-phosphate isomerase-like protein (cupin superfamily)